MGIDAEIFFELTDNGDTSGLALPGHFSVELASEPHHELGMTHRVWCGVRYYGISYDRGPWPDICAVLMSLFATRDVKRIWYFGDDQDADTAVPITIDDVLRISRHYMSRGETPDSGTGQ
jgi:hypothetical protein